MYRISCLNNKMRGGGYKVLVLIIILCHNNIPNLPTPLTHLTEEETPPPLQQPPTPKPRTHYPNPTPLTHPTTEEETPPPPPLRQPPTPKPRTHYPTPEASIEMAITEASVILAKGKVEDLLTPESSVILRQTNFLASATFV